MKAPVMTVENTVNKGHNIMAKDATVLAREDNYWCRKIREAIAICVRHPEINRDGDSKHPNIFLQLLPCDNHQHGHMTPEGNSV